MKGEKAAGNRTGGRKHMWTQEKLEELYKKVNERAAKEPAFYEKVLKNPKEAMEEVAGCELPADMGLQYIEKDANYGGTFVIPDFAEGEIDMTEMHSAAGGTSDGNSACGAYKGQGTQKNNISIALIVSVCAVAVQTGPDASACLAAFGLGEACAVEACAARACVANACGAEADVYDICSSNACAAEAAKLEYCEGQACAADACREAACAPNVCAAEGGFSCQDHTICVAAPKLENCEGQLCMVED